MASSVPPSRALSSKDSVPTHVFLTGKPGIGKTTAIRRIVSLLGNSTSDSSTSSAASAAQSPQNIDGFYTEERRQSGKRVGFDVVTITGQRCSLADVIPDQPDPTRKRPRHIVGRYGVNVDSFERTALPILRRNTTGACVNQFVVVDEIGKMEAFSREFLQKVKELLDRPGGGAHVIGTIPVAGGRYPPALQAVLQQIHTHPNCTVLEVTERNRQEIPARVADMLR